MEHIVNIKNFVDNSDVLGITRYLAHQVQQKTYLPLSYVFGTICKDDLRTLINDCMNEEPLQLVYFTLVAMTAEGEISLSEDKLDDIVKISQSLLACECLRRLDLIEVNPEDYTYTKQIEFKLTEEGDKILSKYNSYFDKKDGDTKSD